MVKSGRAKRMEKHHKRNKGAGQLNLVSLMDIFTILVTATIMLRLATNCLN